MKIVLYVLKALFFFFGFYSSLVSVYEGVNIVFTEFHISILRRFVVVFGGLDLLDRFLTNFLIIFLKEVLKS